MKEPDTDYEFVAWWFETAREGAKKQGRNDSAYLWDAGLWHLKFLKKENNKLRQAREFVCRWGTVDGGHHKAWVIDQLLKILAGDEYEEDIREIKDGVDGADTYSWDEGIAP